MKTATERERGLAPRSIQELEVIALALRAVFWDPAQPIDVRQTALFMLERAGCP